MTKITYEDINESLFDLDSEYGEALANAVMKLNYISASPLQLSYGTWKQREEWEKFSNRPLKAKEIKKIINSMREEMKGDFQYGGFRDIAEMYLNIANKLEIQEKKNKSKER